MKVANTVDLKNKTNELLRQVMNGEALIITYRGKPAASLTALSEDDLEDFVLEHSPKVRKMLAEAEGDRKAGRVLPLAAYVAKARSQCEFSSPERQWLSAADKPRREAPAVSCASYTTRDYRSARNSSSVSPASRTMPPMVNAFTGLCRGIVMIRTPSVITMCLPCRATRKPAFCRARTAS